MHYKLGISTHLKYRKFSSFNREMKYEKQVIIKHNGQKAVMEHLLATTYPGFIKPLFIVRAPFGFEFTCSGLTYAVLVYGRQPLVAP